MAKRATGKTSKLESAIGELYPDQADALVAEMGKANITAENLHNAPVLMRTTCGVDIYEFIDKIGQQLNKPKPAVKKEPVALNPAGDDQPKMEV